MISHVHVYTPTRHACTCNLRLLQLLIYMWTTHLESNHITTGGNQSASGVARQSHTAGAAPGVAAAIPQALREGLLE